MRLDELYLTYRFWLNSTSLRDVDSKQNLKFKNFYQTEDLNIQPSAATAAVTLDQDVSNYMKV